MTALKHLNLLGGIFFRLIEILKEKILLHIRLKNRASFYRHLSIDLIGASIQLVEVIKLQ